MLGGVETLEGAIEPLPDRASHAPANVSTHDVTGVLNINKPYGLTSHAVVNRVRRMVQQKRIGHAGTLDPCATGVLVLCLGQATRIAEYVAEARKVYRATVRLGVTSTTWDSEGALSVQQDCSGLSEEAIHAALARFLGTILQVPPMYSALKHEGRPLYKLARQGLTVEREARAVRIYALHIEAWNPPDLVLRVECSKGTYVRSLAHDLGEALGTGAYLAGLVRLAVGALTLEQAISLDALESAAERGDWRGYVQPMRTALGHMPGVVADASVIARIRLGQAVPLDADPGQPLRCVYAADGALVAIARYDPLRAAWQAFKVLAE